MMSDESVTLQKRILRKNSLLLMICSIGGDDIVISESFTAETLRV
jgi:hypothetical protein